MGTLSLASSGGGTISLAPASSASSATATLPAVTGQVQINNNMPAFSVYQSSSQVISAATLTKVQLQSKEFDTANYFDNTTNYRFTPQVAGYYQISGGCYSADTASQSVFYLSIYKNGSIYKLGTAYGVTLNQPCAIVSSLVYFNGSTDYVELYAGAGLGFNTAAASHATYFQGCLVRSA